jgi:hypothetical protein
MALLSDVDAKNSLKQHFTVAVALHNWTMKLGVFRGD